MKAKQVYSVIGTNTSRVYGTFPTLKQAAQLYWQLLNSGTAAITVVGFKGSSLNDAERAELNSYWTR